MQSVLPILIGLAMAATLIALAVGVVTMVRRGDNARMIGNKMMQMRVLFQAVAIALIVIVMLLYRH